MKSTVMLPVERPIITTWANQAHVFSVVQRHPGYKAWMYSHFVQLELGKGLSSNDLVVNYSYLTVPQEQCPWIDVTRTTLQEIESTGDLISFFKTKLSEGIYMYLVVNQYYIPNYPFYRQKDDFHDPMLVGFDDNRNVFYLADFHKNADGAIRYGVFEVACRDLEDAVRKLPEQLNLMGCMELWQYCPDVPFAFNLSSVMEALSDYLQSTFTPQRELTWMSTPITEYGINIYEHLLKHMEEAQNDEKKGDFRFFHVLSDHKQLMLLRLEYMHEIGLIAEAGVKSYEELLLETSILRNLLLKFGINRKPALLDRIMLMLRDLTEKERRILSDVLGELRERKLASVQKP